MEKDVDSLYEVLVEFWRWINLHFKLNINDYLTLPSLTMAIFRSRYLRHRIPVLTGIIEKCVRAAYRGGRTEAFISEIRNGFMYDVNSLFPTAMLKCMPVGQPYYILNPKLNDFYGFCYAIVEIPRDISLPLLGITVDGRAMYPTGTIEGWYYSEQLKKAVECGCVVTVLDGYEFERGFDVFTAFVSDFYDRKANASSEVERFIYKLMLNSLYGRFGMTDEDNECKIVASEELEEIQKYYHINSYTQIDSNTFIVDYGVEPDRDLCGTDEEFMNLVLDRDTGNRRLSSVAISAAITAEASLIMHDLMKNINVYYTDTDSIVTDKPLPDHMVNNQLGGLKLEHEIE